MPLDDTAVLLCAEVKLPDDVILIGPRGDSSQIALDKRRQIDLAGKVGFAVPPSQSFENEREILEHEVDFPVVVKPALAMRKNGASLSKERTWICSDRNELRLALADSTNGAPMLLQKYIVGEGQGLFGLATSRGVIAWSGHRRLRMMNPHGSGASACTVVEKIDADCKAAAERFVAACEWRGLFMIEMLREESGRLWFMEFNGRPWGSMALARRIGLEYPAWAAQLALEPEKNIDVRATEGYVPVCRHLGREILYLLFVLRGPRSKAVAAWPSIWRGIADVIRVGRNDRWYNWRRDDSAVFLSDCYATLRDQLLKPKYKR
jgi:carbamoylphosphate synthase large subunit